MIKITPEYITKLYINGLSIGEIIEKYRVSEKEVVTALQEYGFLGGM